MAQHTRATSAVPQLRTARVALLAWHDKRPRAPLSSVRGWGWVLLISAVFFWMSNPLVIVPGFHLSLEKSTYWTVAILVVTLPWARFPRVPWPWIVFHAVTYVSFLWTIDPHLTDYTALLYLKLTLIGLVIVANCEPPVVCWGMGLGGVVVVALSIYAYNEQLWGTSNGANGGAEFTGVGTNENILAYTLSVSLAAILAAQPPRRPVPLTLWMAVAAINGYGVYLAGSGTGFLTVLGVLLIFSLVVAWPALRSRRRSHLLVGSGILTAVLAGVTFLIVAVLGKDLLSLSGRAPFWRAAWDSTMETAPVLGSGWGAVWTHPWSMVPLNEVAQDIYDRAGDAPSHGHNFFVDVLPELGLLGVALAVLMVGYSVRQVVRSGLHDPTADPVAGRLVLLVLVALLISGITEPMFTVPLGWWSLALVTALSRQRVLPAQATEQGAPEDEAVDSSRQTTSTPAS